MAQLLEKRRSLHLSLENQQKINKQLKNEIGQMQALANLGMVSAMIAHEMNNILTPLGSYAEFALQNPEDVELTRKALNKTQLNTARASKILESMLSLAGGKMKQKKIYSLLDIVNEIFDCLARDFGKDGIEVTIEIDPTLNIWVERSCFQQVLMNLILNAREAMIPRGGRLVISASQSYDRTDITVSDTGSGISEGNLKRIFEPFFSTKSQDSDCSRNGIGLGLAFCKRVISEHEGSINVESTQNVGTIFKISLPFSQGPL